jgi:hypothetical protein
VITENPRASGRAAHTGQKSRARRVILLMDCDSRTHGADMARSRRISWLLTALALTAAVALPTGPVAAQNITLKTVPVPTGEQFLLFPSHAFGMGSATIAVDDPLGRPFANPAVRLVGDERGRVFASPTFYGEANGWVGGRSLPLAALLAGDRFHGGLGLAVQQLQDRRWGWGWTRNSVGSGSLVQGDPTNTYLFGTLGMRIAEGVSAGVSALHADLSAVDGVNMLYGRAMSIEQAGSLLEVRAGFLGDLGGGRTLEGTITNTRLDMRHDVGYIAWNWIEGATPDAPEWTSMEWTERNDDRTITWGTRLRYTQPLDDVARLGFVLAGSTKAHPKIPNYNIVDIPRDPGNSAVFNLGVGLSRAEAGTTMAMEVVFEPGRSHTWAFADADTTLPSGAVLQRGDKTVDNQFRFRNWNLGLGLDREAGRFGYQLGLRVRQIRYTLDQQHFLGEVRRETREKWMEWTPSWGGRVAFGSMALRYDGRFTARGWPEGAVFGWADSPRLMSADAGVDFMVGPTGPVDIPAFRVTTHRLTLSVPFGL